MMKKIDKNVIYLGWVSFFTDMASSMITTLLPIFIVYILNEGVDKLGIIIAIATFVSYAFRILFGYISDKYQIVKPFVVGGYLISACAKPFLAFSTTYVSVALVRVADRMGKAIRSASKDALISSYVKQTAHGRTFGFHKMMDIAGELSGALLVFLAFLYFAQDENTIRTIFALSAIPGVLAVLIAVLLVKDMPKSKKTTRAVINKEDFKLFGLLFLYFGFVFFLMSEQFFIVKAKEEGFSLGMIPLLLMVFTGVQTIVSYYGGVLSDKAGTFRALFLSFVFGFFSLLLAEFNLWLAFASLGVFTVISLNSIRGYISKNALSKSFVYGVFYAGTAVFAAGGALVIGYIWKIYGFESVLVFSQSGMLFMIVLLVLLKKRIV